MCGTQTHLTKKIAVENQRVESNMAAMWAKHGKSAE